MAKKQVKFALMNVLIMGTSFAIKNALEKVDKDYELKESTYNPKKVKADDKTIVKAGLVFDEWYEGFITPEEIPFADISDIKFIGLGNGGDGCRTDGSYVFYKDFGEDKVSECYRFSDINAHMEEFDAQDDVLEKVQNSFMDHTWQFEFEDYSCGEMVSWAFNGKKDKELISKWTGENSPKVSACMTINDIEINDELGKILETVSEESYELKVYSNGKNTKKAAFCTQLCYGYAFNVYKKAFNHDIKLEAMDEGLNTLKSYIAKGKNEKLKNAFLWYEKLFVYIKNNA